MAAEGSRGRPEDFGLWVSSCALQVARFGCIYGGFTARQLGHF